jgi:GDP-L-fucose synthase
MNPKFWKNKKILVTGASGFLGTHFVKELKKLSPQNLSTPSHKDHDFRQFNQCHQVVENIDLVIHLAAKVGGIGFNQKYPGEMFYDNLIMGVQLMEAARQAGAKKFVSIGTVCAYPKFTPTPFKEEDIWNGYPEESNAPYGLAKKMLLVQGQAYSQQYGFNAIYLLPANLYGPGDKFDLDSSHVIPALIRKFIIAKKENKKSVTVWGTGNATREFLYVQDAAEAIILATEKYNQPDPINLGSGLEISIRKLAEMIKDLTEFKGKINWDKTKPDGQPRRNLDVSKAKKKFNFKARTNFNQGLKTTIKWYLKNKP